MKDGVGEGRTRADHMDVANSIYTAYSRGRKAMDLSLVIGEEALTRQEREHLQFAREFEAKFIKQGKYTRRDVEKTLNLAIELLEIVQKG